MKTFTYLLTSVLTVAALTGFSQNQENPGQELYKHNTRIKEHALKIKYGESRTHKEHVKNTEEIGKNLDSVVTDHEKIKKKIPKRLRDDVQRNSLSVEKQLSEARRHHSALMQELSKEKHDEMIVRYHATKIHTSLEKAEKEEGIILAKTER